MTYTERIERYGRETVLENKRQDYQNRREYCKAQVYAYRAKNKEHWLKVSREYQQRRAKEDPLYWRKKSLKSVYGLTFEQYQHMWDTQHGCCAICHEDLAGKRSCIDHDHATGVVRGILCNGCNVGIAHFRESPAKLEAAIQYLRQAGSVRDQAS